jgi:predicted nuclease with TOPRIM domain
MSTTSQSIAKKFLTEIEEMITTAHAWKDVAKGPVIYVELTEVQSAEVDATIRTLEGVRDLYDDHLDELTREIQQKIEERSEVRFRAMQEDAADEVQG